MKMKKWLPIVLSIVAIASIVITFVLFFVAVPRTDGVAYKRVLGVIAGILFVFLALLSAYYIFLMQDRESNFFLFDRAKKRNIDVEQLNFAIVNDRMNFFLVYINTKPVQLWQEGVLDNNNVFGYRGVYRPLVAYKMLFDLTENDSDVYWDCLFNASNETINSLCRALEQGGEREMTKAIRFLTEKPDREKDKIKDFVKSNSRYIRGRMLNYVKKHIELFY
jgi:hypothetical protein